MSASQVQVIKVDHIVTPPKEGKPEAHTYLYLFVVRENPEDLTSWGYQNSWRMRNPAPEDVLELNATYTVHIARAMEMIGSFNGDKDIRAVNNYSGFKKFSGMAAAKAA